MTEPTVFVELCAGLGALSLSAVAGRPIPNVWARPGGKTGYARVIWRALGLSGWRPSRIVWAEPDPACRVMLAAYSRPDVLREAAAWCRRWGAEYGEEGQRRLWEDLRAEGPPDEGAADMGREVARVGAVQRRTVSQAGARAFGGPSKASWMPPHRRVEGWSQYGTDSPRDWFERQPLARWPETVLHRDGREVEPIPGAVVVIDPPYLGTHGYEAGGVLPRADVVAMARRWAEAGAVVAVCEAVPVAQEMGPGWCSIDITGERTLKGSRCGTVTEWLTLSRPAVAGWRTRGQQGLFG
jgi:hypothetical protein